MNEGQEQDPVQVQPADFATAFVEILLGIRLDPDA
jgi:hypothetical protein